MNGFFITGTDTNIGKTSLSALLLAELRRRGTNAGPMKPTQTGCFRTPGTNNLSVPDLDYSLSMASMHVSAATYSAMSPYTFEPACSPHLAAEMAGTKIDLSEIIIAARTLSTEYDLVIAEGAGGVIVPLNRHETTLDLMQALKLPIILVARPNLGTINHTLLSIRTLRSDGLNIAGIVFVATQENAVDFIEDDNQFTIEQLSHVPILGTLPYCPALCTPTPCFDNLPLPIIAAIEKITNQLIQQKQL